MAGASIDADADPLYCHRRMDVIASRKNPFVATVRRVADGDDRDRVLLDGLHLLE
jgi:hypothetical protein